MSTPTAAGATKKAPLFSSIKAGDLAKDASGKSNNASGSSGDVQVVETNVPDFLNLNHPLVLHRDTRKTLESIELDRLDAQIATLTDRFSAIKNRVAIEKATHGGASAPLQPPSQATGSPLSLTEFEDRVRDLERFYEFHC